MDQAKMAEFLSPVYLAGMPEIIAAVWATTAPPRLLVRALSETLR